MVKVETGDATVRVRIDPASRPRVPSQLEAVPMQRGLNVTDRNVSQQVNESVLVGHERSLATRGLFN